jgi:hypothetical protein
MRSFSTDAMDNYFKNKGLTYVIFAVEGASYASALHTIEKLNLKPKIVMTNNEILFSNVVGDAFGDLVYFPDKYKTRFDFFHAAQSVQKWACQSGIKKLEDFYCTGRRGAGWRSAVTGRFKWELVAEEEKNIPFTARDEQDPPTLRMSRVLPNAKEFTGISQFKDSCQLLYLVNSPASEPNLMRSIGDLFEIETVYADDLDLKSYDGSHLDRPSSEAWAAEFVKALDPAIDRCLSSGGGQPNFDKLEAYLKIADAEQAELEARRDKAIALRDARLEASKNRKENAEAALQDRLEAREERDAKAAAIVKERAERRAEQERMREAARLAAITPKGVVYEGAQSNVSGKTDFESWDISKGITMVDSAAMAPNGRIEADKMIVDKSPSRIRYLVRDRPIQAGTTMTFGAWVWSGDEGAAVRLQLVRSCSPDTPVETGTLNSVLTSEPHRMEVSHTFEYDHDCALVQILGFGEGAEINLWQGITEFSQD